MKTLIIIPAYNEGPVLKDTLTALRHYGKINQLTQLTYIVINDGSTDHTQEVALEYADFVLTHRRNCGLGASLATGIEYAKNNHFDACITFDADGQHDPKDISSALKKLAAGYDVVIGSRFLGKATNLKPLRRLILYLSNIVTWVFFHIWTSDSQSGFRALSKHAISCLHLKSNRMEVSSEFFGEIGRCQLSFVEIPIHIRYTAYSLKKGQQNLQSAGVLLKLVYMLLR
jgi:glycosyltransferase involved in cell wall biosynthesis